MSQFIFIHQPMKYVMSTYGNNIVIFNVTPHNQLTQYSVCEVGLTAARIAFNQKPEFT